ncbi:MAG TPA: cupin domain-containing protein [Hyphomicrobiales bacterium]|nr:cupin domain-containing protein [Hyphomicrobiales bacterium]
MNPVVNILGELEHVTEYRSPRIIGRVNDQYIKVAKLKGEFVWHKHDDEDELFYIVKGQLTMRYEDGQVVLNEGDFHVVPKGVMHNPLAEEECWIVLIETVTTKHSGDVASKYTKSIEEQLGASK